MEIRLKKRDQVASKSTQTTELGTPGLKRKNSQEIVSLDEKKKTLARTSNRVSQNLINLKASVQGNTQTQQQASAPKPSMKGLFENDDSCFGFSQLTKLTRDDTKQQVRQKKANAIDISVSFQK